MFLKGKFVLGTYKNNCIKYKVSVSRFTTCDKHGQKPYNWGM